MALGDGLSLLFKIKADSDQARKEISTLSSVVSKELKQVEAASKTTTSSLGGLGSGISSLLSPTNLLVGGALAAGTAIFSLGKQALDSAGQLFDLSQKTNFAVETLSALKNAGETSGTSIESISAALGIFDKNIVKAASGNKELEATFKRLNISTTDNEKALRDAFRALSQMDDGAQQTAAAMELFGRSGKDVLGVIKETNGDLDKAISKYKEMGTLISTETATAADELGDSLTRAGQSITGVATDLIRTLAPALKAIIFLVEQAINAIRGWIIVLNALFSNPAMKYAESIYKLSEGAKKSSLAGLVSGVAGGISLGAQPERDRDMQDIGGGAGRRGSGLFAGGGGRGGGGARGRAATPEKGADDFGGDLLQNLKEQLTTLASTDDALGKVAAQVVNLERRHGKLGEAIHSELITAAQRLGQMQQEIKLRNDTRTFIERQNEAVRQKVEGDKSEYDKVGELIERYKAQGRELRDNVRDLLQLNALLLDSGKILESLEGLSFPDIFGGGEVGGIMSPEGVGAAATAAAGISPEGQAATMSTLDIMGEKLTNFFNTGKEGAAAWSDALGSAMHAVTEGMGDMIYAFLMGEKMSGKAFMAMAKAAIASIAAQAAVRAIFELAMGLASMWLNPAEAATHFLAAKTFGLVAAMAGLASLAIPGGGGTAAAGNAGTGSAGSSRTSGQTAPTAIDANRRGSEQRIIIDIRPTDAFIIDTAVGNIQKNGKLRMVLGNESLATT